MKARFNITHDPEFTGIIGIQTKWDNERKTLELTQTALIDKIAERFKEHIPDSRKTKFTPLPEKLDKTDPNERCPRSLTKPILTRLVMKTGRKLDTSTSQVLSVA